ncbi:hypothetical protein BV22DRAFT_415790 [Leucogyrophana mollusca]|uniref:Uncharacterized protein n=1 Tax=Leucogyrophana mollusca TaxID=85980 RepID=A0ACB8BLD3_9AGAM|nr:hypothetical protein BV22DRAFT_415790 [Leucogyrophana mollusca]
MSTYLLLVISILPMAFATPPTPTLRTLAINVREAISEATCTPEYAWMNNAENQSPCLVVAYVEGLGLSLLYPSVPITIRLTPPMQMHATDHARSSWSSYNLLMACTLCQGPQFENSTLTWAEFYSPACPSSFSDVYFPSGYTLDTASSLPYWASMNPQNWTNAQFNVDQALQIADMHYADLTPSPSASASASAQHSSSSSLGVGAIVGIVIGSLAFILIVAIASYLLRKKWQTVKRRSAHLGELNLDSGGDGESTMLSIPHTRWPSWHSSSEYPPSSVGSPAPMQSIGQTLAHPMQQFGQLHAPLPGYPSGAYAPVPVTDASTTYTSRSGPNSNAIPMV